MSYPLITIQEQCIIMSNLRLGRKQYGLIVSVNIDFVCTINNYAVHYKINSLLLFVRVDIYTIMFYICLLINWRVMASVIICHICINLPNDVVLSKSSNDTYMRVFRLCNTFCPVLLWDDWCHDNNVLENQRTVTLKRNCIGKDISILLKAETDFIEPRLIWNHTKPEIFFIWHINLVICTSLISLRNKIFPQKMLIFVKISKLGYRYRSVSYLLSRMLSRRTSREIQLYI